MILIVILVALLLRLINLNQSLWLDEAINVLAITQYGLFDMVTKYSLADFHPPGYFALLWMWTSVGGTEEIWVRLPSVLFGVLTIYFTYLLGNELFKKKVGLLASLLMAIAPLHVYYSQEARMYALAAFPAVASFTFFIRVLKRGGKLNQMGYITSSILVVYSDYLTYLIFPAQLLYILLFEREKIKIFFLPVVTIILAAVPWFLIFPSQLATGVGAAAGLPGWKEVVGGAGIKDLLLIPIKTFFGRISIENKLYYGLVSGLVSVVFGYIFYQGLKKFDKQTKLLILWIIIPLSLAFVVSFFIPVLTYFRMLFILPPFYLILAKGIDALGFQRISGRLAIIALCLISLISLGAYFGDPKFQREDWRGAVKKVETIATENSLILFESNDVISPFKYYQSGNENAQGGLTKVPAKNYSDIANIPPQIEEIYLFEYLLEITDPLRLLEKSIEREGFDRKKTLNFNGVGFVHYYTLK